MIEGEFFQDLAILMAVAGLVAAFFSRLGWPKVLGYILAGVAMGEATWGGSFLNDVASTKTIGQLGIVFLMFGMGLSFSPKDMRSIRSVALPSAAFDTLIMVWLGYTVGTRCFGWTPVQSLFLGVAICDSATTLLAKVIDELGWGRRQFTKYVLGTSVCEDIICVGALAVVTGFAQGGRMSAGAFVLSLGGLGAFFLTVLVFGFILVPRLLKSVATRKDDEALVLTILGICFFISYFAYKFEFSLALGAFLVGMLGSVSDVRQRLGSLVEPLKAMFSSVFFVSIGLMVDPGEIWRCLPQILVVSAVVVVGKLLNNFVASLVTGLDVKTAVQNGFSLAQIGEFAFMVAILYVGFVDDPKNPFFQVAVGTSLVTTLLNPWMIRASDRAGDWAERLVPEQAKAWLSSYHAWLEKIRAANGSPAFRRLRTDVIKLGVYAVLILSVSILSSMLYRIDFTRFSRLFERHDRTIFFFLANLFVVALLPLVLSAARDVGGEIAFLLTGDGTARWQVATRQFICFVVLVTVFVLFFVEWSMINVTVHPVSIPMQGLSAAAVIGVGVFGWRFFVKTGRRATQRFQEALTAEERHEGLLKTMTISLPEGTVHRLKLDADSPAIGGTVVTLDIRAKTGASVLAVHRGEQVVRNVGPEWEFRIGDVLVVLGDQQQVAALKDLLGVT